MVPSAATSTSRIHSSNSWGSSFSPMEVRTWRRSATETVPDASLSRTRKASRSGRSKGSGRRWARMSSRNRLKSKGAVSFSWAVMSRSCACVGFPPRERMRTPSSEGAMRPSPSVSKREKASRIEATCSSLSSLPAIAAGGVGSGI
ncbi:hypothetical protein VPH35_129765 [Triticum aestivum]